MDKQDWYKKLNPEEYRVLREAGTEAPFSSELNAVFDEGTYFCKGCGTPLFASNSKFDGHCGWPSFDLEIEDGIIEKRKDSSHGMVRTEIICARCKSHLGHLFDDGPTSSGLRYCVNGISLTFEQKKIDDWFENWFDSPYYPLLYQKRNIEEAENFISNLITYLQLQQNATILDLACGEGRHSNFLAKNGFDVTGLDLSKRSIEIAKENAIGKVTFDIADMRTFSINKRFDFIFNLFTSFGYFENIDDNILVLNQVNKHLKKEGILVIDFLNKHLVIKNLVKSEDKSVGGIDFKITRKISNNSVVKTIRFNIQDQTKKFHEKVQLFDLSEFKVLLGKTGFNVLKSFGDYELNAFNEDSSPRLIIIAKKK